MKFDFAIVGVGSTGDIRPLLAIAKGLKDSGYNLRFVSHENFRELVESLGLPFFPIAGDYRKLLRSSEGIDITSGERRPWEEPSQMKAERALQLRQVLAAAEGARAVIVGPLSIWASNITEKLRIPIIVTSYFPLQKTQYFPILQFGKGIDLKIGPLRRWANAASYSVVQLLKSLSDRKTINDFRQSIDLKSLMVFPRYDPEAAKKVLILHQYSESVLPFPPDWHDAPYTTKIVGYCFVDETFHYEPSESLTSFINGSDRPVISLGFGSMPIGQPADTYELISQAIRIAQVKCVFIPGWGSDSLQFEPQPDIYIDNQVPYRWLFPNMSAVVHHCGAGTTAASIRAGVPVVPVPFFADQPAWGERLHELGMAAAPIPAKSLTAKLLATAIKQAVTSSDMSKQAKALSSQVNQENGVLNAVKLITEFMDD